MAEGRSRHSSANKGTTVGVEATQHGGRKECAGGATVCGAPRVVAVLLRPARPPALRRHRSRARGLPADARLRDMSAIRDLEAYLYSVASNLAKEHAAAGRRRGVSVSVDEATIQDQLAQAPSFEGEILTAQQVKRLRAVLRGLPPKCHAAVVLQYVHGQSHQQIAQD